MAMSGTARCYFSLGFVGYKGEKLRYSFTPGFEARYLVLSFGIFATCAGLMYNDLSSVGMQLFQIRREPSGSTRATASGNQPTSSRILGHPPLEWTGRGLGASNELLYLNSMKMKLSVLFGCSK